MSAEQVPLFEVVTEPLSEVEDLPSVPRGFISWADLQKQWGYEPEQFEEDHDGAMSPVDVDTYFDDTQHIADYLASERDNMRLDKE